MTEDNDTDRQTRTDDENRQTMKDVDHTHPDTDEAFGDSGVYDRGGNDDRDHVRSDGGQLREAGRGTHPTRSHTPPKGIGAQRAFDRGPTSNDAGS